MPQFALPGLAMAPVAWLAVMVTIPTRATADVVIDYSLDTSNFFANVMARDALQQAVDDINNVIDFNLAAITNDITTGIDGNNELNFDFSYNFTHPATGATETIDDTTLTANEFRIFAGARSLASPTAGRGGPAGAGFGVTGFTGTPGTPQGAVDDANARWHGGGGQL